MVETLNKVFLDFRWQRRGNVDLRLLRGAWVCYPST